MSPAASRLVWHEGSFLGAGQHRRAGHVMSERLADRVPEEAAPLDTRCSTVREIGIALLLPRTWFGRVIFTMWALQPWAFAGSDRFLEVYDYVLAVILGAAFLLGGRKRWNEG